MEPTQSVGLAHFLSQTDTLGKVILGCLVLMSLISWYLIVTKTLTVVFERRRSAGFLDAFWNSPSITAVETELEKRHPDEPFAHLAWHALSARGKGDAEFLTRAMRRVIDEDT